MPTKTILTTLVIIVPLFTMQVALNHVVHAKQPPPQPGCPRGTLGQPCIVCHYH